MHRTQVLLPFWLNDYIDKHSKKRGISKGEFVRIATAECVTGLDSDDYETVDEFIYECRKRIERRK